MTPEQEEKKLTENFIDQPRIVKLYELQRLLKQQSPAWDLIFDFTGGQLGDIVEVFWSEGGSAQANASPSFKFPILPPPSRSENISKLFSSISTTPSQFWFDSDRSILFLSPLMPPLDIERFIDQISEHERGLIQRLAINHHTFENFDHNQLIKFKALKELILVSEIPTEENPLLGPIAQPPQRVIFGSAESSEPRSYRPWDPNDLRLQMESKLGDLRDLERAWPGAPVKVDVVCIKRDGKPMDTEFVSMFQKDVVTKMKDEEKADAKRAAEAKEREEATAYAAKPDSDAGESDVDESVEVGKLASRLESSNLGNLAEHSSSTIGYTDVTAEDMLAIAEADRNAAARTRMAELRKEKDQIEAIGNPEEEAEGFDMEVDDEDDGANDADEFED